MKAYTFKAALCCEDCAADIKAALEKTTGQPPLELRESSDHWPQGPYGNGGGEADTPQHCDSCGEFLENPLTSDGVKYVREVLADIAPPYRDQTWDDVAKEAEAIGAISAAQWARFYFAPGQ